MGGLVGISTRAVRAVLLVVAPALAPGLRGPARGHALSSVLLSITPPSVALLAPPAVGPVVRRSVAARIPAVAALVLGLDAGTPGRPGVVRAPAPVPVRVTAVGLVALLVMPPVTLLVPLLVIAVSLLMVSVALLVASVPLLMATVSLLMPAAAMAVGTGLLSMSRVPLLTAPHAAVVPTVLVLGPALAVAVGGVAVVVGVALVGGVVVTVPVRPVPTVLVAVGPAFVAGPPAVVVHSVPVGLVSSSVFSVRICHGSLPS